MTDERPKNRTRVRWLDEQRDMVRLTANYVGTRDNVIWALSQLLTDLRTGRAPRRKERTT